MKQPVAALVGCSNGLNRQDPKIVAKVARLQTYLEGQGWAVKTLPSIWAPPEQTALPALVRAQLFEEAVRDPEVVAILDPTGGDVANQVLPALDFDLLRSHPKPYFGYSDNSVLLNALHFSAGWPVWMFQPLHLASAAGQPGRQIWQSLWSHLPFVPPFWQPLRGDLAAGNFAGGNLRSLLKLAGTRWWPDLTGRTLLLESWGADGPVLASGLAHLAQLGVFDQIAALLLGTFSKLAQAGGTQLVRDLALEATAPWQTPLAQATWFGHGEDAIPVPFGHSTATEL